MTLGKKLKLVVAQQYDYPTIWLSVAEFNERAMKVYERVGFHKVGEKMQAMNGGMYRFVVMTNKE